MWVVNHNSREVVVHTVVVRSGSVPGWRLARSLQEAHTGCKERNVSIKPEVKPGGTAVPANGFTLKSVALDFAAVRAFSGTESKYLSNCVLWSLVWLRLLRMHLKGPMWCSADSLTYNKTLFTLWKGRDTCLLDRDGPEDASFILLPHRCLLFPCALSLRGFDSTSHIVFINITCFLAMAHSVCQAENTWKKHFSLAQHWFWLSWFPGQGGKNASFAQIGLFVQWKANASKWPWNRLNKKAAPPLGIFNFVGSECLPAKQKHVGSVFGIHKGHN